MSQTDNAPEYCDSGGGVVENEQEMVNSEPSLGLATDTSVGCSPSSNDVTSNSSAAETSSAGPRYPRRNRGQPNWLGDWVT